MHKAKKSLELKNKNVFARAKKALGQNFLKSESILRKIVEAGEVTKNDVVLEIGPGKGALTSKLLETKCKVLAVEKDDQLFEFLQEKFAEEIKNKKIILINDDILDFASYSEAVLAFSSADDAKQAGREKEHKLRSDHGSFAGDTFSQVLGKNPQTIRKSTSGYAGYKIIANIPYNITGAILKKFLTEENQPEMMVLMVQHEVAKRIVANDGKESILSISVKAYGEPKMIMKVDKRYFSPAPKVNSAVIKINNINRKIFEENNVNEEKFWEIVKKGFAHKRKKLSGNLKKVISDDKLASLGLQDKRAENLTLRDWILLTK